MHLLGRNWRTISRGTIPHSGYFHTNRRAIRRITRPSERSNWTRRCHWLIWEWGVCCTSLIGTGTQLSPPFEKQFLWKAETPKHSEWQDILRRPSVGSTEPSSS